MSSESKDSARFLDMVPREALYLFATPFLIAFTWAMLGGLGIDARFILMNGTVIIPLAAYVLMGNERFRLTWALVISVSSYIIMEIFHRLLTTPGILALDTSIPTALIAIVYAALASWLVTRYVRRSSKTA